LLAFQEAFRGIDWKFLKRSVQFDQGRLSGREKEVRDAVIALDHRGEK
jgi:hypothetical protein